MVQFFCLIDMIESERAMQSGDYRDCKILQRLYKATDTVRDYYKDCCKILQRL